MKRQVAVIGPTPEFTRWSIRKHCPLREDTDVSSVDQTEKRLRAVRAAGLAMGQHRELNGIAVFDDPASVKSQLAAALQTPLSTVEIKGFRISDVIRPWTDPQELIDLCGGCPANVLNDPLLFGSLAGCHGWIRRDEVGDAFVAQIDRSWPQVADAQAAADRFLDTQPRWYGLWSIPQLQAAEQRIVYAVLRHALSASPDKPRCIVEFCLVLRRCMRFELPVDVELLPIGNSDGVNWTMERHCDRCRAARTEPLDHCSVCGKTGDGHPPVKRKALGLRPYVDLNVLMDAEHVREFLLKYTEPQTAPRA